MSFRKEVYEMNESKDLSQYHDTVAKWTDNNNDMEIRMLMAKLIGNKKIIQKIQAINAIVDAEREMPHTVNEYMMTVYRDMQELGRKKFGKENWNKNIYNPS